MWSSRSYERILTISMNCVASRGLGKERAKSIRNLYISTYCLLLRWSRKRIGRVCGSHTRVRISQQWLSSTRGISDLGVIRGGKRRRATNLQATRRGRQLRCLQRGLRLSRHQTENIFLDASGNALFMIPAMGDAAPEEGMEELWYSWLPAPCLLSENPWAEGPEVDCWSLGAVLISACTVPRLSRALDLKTFKKTGEGKYQRRHGIVAPIYLVSRLLEVDRSKRATLQRYSLILSSTLLPIVINELSQHKSKRFKRASASKKEKKSTAIRN